MRDIPGGLARAAVHRPRRTLALWGVAIVASLALIATLLPSALTTEGRMTSDPESYRGYAVVERHFPSDPATATSDVVVVRDTGGARYDTPAFRAHVGRLVADLREAGLVRTAVTPYGPRGGELVSPDGDTALVLLGLTDDDRVDEAIAIVDRAERDGFATAITGESTVDHDFTKLSQEDLKKGEFQIGLPAALIVLLLVFGSIAAGLVPVLTALVSIVVALALTAVLGQAFDLSVFVVNMLTGMGLALGIDYALFVLSRFREERNGGRHVPDAIEVAGRTANRAVLFSGSAFVLAMVGMVLVPDTILRSLATGAILVGVVSVVASLTLLPALLAVLGDRVNAWRLPWLGRRVEASAGTEGRLWAGVVSAVMRRPLLSAAASVAMLLALAVPILDFPTGQAGVRSIPDRFASKQGFTLLEQELGVGTVDEVQVALTGPVASEAGGQALERLRRALEDDPAFARASVRVAGDGEAAVVSALVTGDSRDQSAIDAVERLRADVVPAATAGTGLAAFVTGETAEVIDYQHLTSRWLPLVLAFVLVLSFVLLLVAFRSVVLPAVAIVLNLLSVGAAYGLLLLVFVHGWAAGLLGFEQVDVIAAWLPLFLFSVLFGLSMDYTVFLMSRIRERHAAGATTREAVAFGVGSTARLVTGAALIIVMVFVGFASGDQVEFQQMGFGVAVSLLIDATLIRLVLMPALLAVLGERTWHLPRALRWLPHLEIEGSARAPASPAGGDATRRAG
jgi:RND superfamily putative drug exporter